MGFGVALGALFGLWLARPKKNQVWKLIPSEHRGFDLEVIKENALSIFCGTFKGLPPQRFIKYRPGWTVVQQARFGRQRKITRHVGRPGTAYTQRFEKGKLENVTLGLTLKTLWGEEFYNKIPQTQRDLIEESQIGVTIELEDDPPTPPGGLPTISEENIKEEQDREAAENFWQGRKAALKSITMQTVFPIGLGVAIGLVAALMLGWIPVAKPG